MNNWRTNHWLPAVPFARLGIVLAFALMAVAAYIFGVQAEGDDEIIQVGLIPDVAGIQDDGFNEMAYQGLLRGQTDYQVIGQVYTPTLPEEYSIKLQQCITEHNDLCIGVGFQMAEAVEAAALANPGVYFAIVDYTYESYSANLRGMYFAVEEAGYLGGVLAARMTGSQKLGAVGGMQIPPVDNFIYGYRQGALCTDPTIQTLISYTNDFTNPLLGEQHARQQLDQGADVILAVAGPTGTGVVMTTTHDQKWAIGVDVDYYYSVFEGGTAPNAQYLLTSVMKRVDNAVYEAIKDLVYYSFTSGTKVYNLENDGVGLAPFHEADPAVSQSVKDELDTVKQDIISGNIDPLSPCPGQTQVGLVSDVAGFNDLSFNWMAYQGLWRAQNELGAFIRTYESTSPDDYPVLLATCVADGNELCIGVGFQLMDAIHEAAGDYPSTKFGIIDVTFDPPIANLRGTYFAVDEASYLGGVLAASMPGVDKLGAIGGMQIPPVDLFIDGYHQGAQCVNPDIPIVVTYTDTFTDPALGFGAAQTQIAWGADVIFPVAGYTSVGAVNAAIEEQVWTMGVDADFYYSMFGGASVPGTEYLLTSVVKRVDNAVYDTIADTKASNFSGGTKVYNLTNQGVGLAPYHDADPAVPYPLRHYLGLLEKDIIAGNITPSSPCRYYIFTPLILR